MKIVSHSPFLALSAFLSVCCASLLVAFPTTAYADTAHSFAASSGHVTVLILDMSGSMSQNDPNGLRCSAANAYIDLSRAGDFVGVIGLDNADGATGGSHNFVRSQVWAQPGEMNTTSARQSLRSTLQDKSHNCKPDGNTPTYDALDQAYQMLISATQGGQRSGSVVLLTDGEPFPNSSDQMSSIQSDLMPNFKSHGWPIDAIALGANAGDFHGFLNTLANATSGKFYDDSQGAVSGISALNLEHFFVDIFKIRNGRTPGSTIPATNINGTNHQDFSVGNFVSHLDVIAVKDQPGTTVTINAPSGQTIPPEAPNVFVSTDPHYVIFSIDNPQPGTWQLNAGGSGMFLMDSLIVSRLSLAITAPTTGKALPLGQPITITGELRDQGNAVVGDQASLKATIAFAGSGGGNAREVQLNDANHTGDYSGTVTIPTTAPAGSYEIDMTATEGSEVAVTAQLISQLAFFPTPVLLSPVTQQPTKDPISARAIEWDPFLRFIYNLPVLGGSVFGWHPSDWPLQGLAANPQAEAQGEVLVGTALYSKATVSASAVQAGSKQVVAVTVMNDGNGHFRIFLPTGAAGQYTVTLTARGAFKDSFGDLVTNDGTLKVTVGVPSLLDEIRAWAITLLYLLVLSLVGIFGIYGPINYAVRAKPGRHARLIDVAMNLKARSRTEMHSGLPLIWHGWSLRRYFAPNRLPASELSLPDNLLFVFRRGNEVAVQVRKPKGKEPAPQWTIDGRPLTHSDGTETILTHMKLAYSEGGHRTEWQFEQDVRGSADFGGGGTTGDRSLRERAEDVAGAVGLRDRLHRRRGGRID
jgi:von Willebrand factor type A domain